MNHTSLSRAGNALPMLPIQAESPPACPPATGPTHLSQISDEAQQTGCCDGTTAPPMALPKTVGRVEPEKPATHAAADHLTCPALVAGVKAGGVCWVPPPRRAALHRRPLDFNTKAPSKGHGVRRWRVIGELGLEGLGIKHPGLESARQCHHRHGLRLEA